MEHEPVIPSAEAMLEDDIKYWVQKREQALLDSEYYTLQESRARMALHLLKVDGEELDV